MMFSANTVMRRSAPPENMSNMPRMPPPLLVEHLGHHRGIDAGDRDVGAETINEQRTEGEPDALLELRRLGEDAELTDLPQAVRPPRPCAIPSRSAPAEEAADASLNIVLRPAGRKRDHASAGGGFFRRPWWSSLPPAASTAAFAVAEAPDTVMLTAASSSPTPSSRTPATAPPRTRPAARSIVFGDRLRRRRSCRLRSPRPACRYSPARIPCGTMLSKPRFGSRR